GSVVDNHRLAPRSPEAASRGWLGSTSADQGNSLRVWISIVPGHGHFFPMVPLARALERAGHEVTFCTSESYAETVVDHGFAALGVGLDYTQGRSEEHTSELQSRENLVCRLLLEK